MKWVPLVHKAIKVRQVKRVLKEARVKPDSLVLLVCKVYKVYKVCQVLKVLLVNKEK